MPTCIVDCTSPLLLENAIQIALNYFERAGEIDDYAETRKFLIDHVQFMIRQGQRNKLILANRAISAYEQHRRSRTIELSLVS
jgi:hypothetical protein